MYFSCPEFPANPQLDLLSLTTTSDLLFLCTVHVWASMIVGATPNDHTKA